MAAPAQGYPYRYAALLSKLLGAKGEQLTEVSPELIAGIILENDRPEYKFLAGEILAGGWGQAVAVAAQRASGALVNPVGSGTLVVVEFASVNSPVAANIRVGLDTAASIITAVVTTVAVGTMKDTRARSANPSASLRFGSTATILGALLSDSVEAANDVEIRAARDVVLSPGFGLVLQDDTFNQTTNFTFGWRERPLEQSELKG